LLQRIEQLEENILLLNRLKKERSLENIKENRFDEWSLRYGLFESIQIVIDLSCHLSSRYNLGATKTYAKCIENLAKHKYIGNDLAKSLISAIGLRNLLIHEYVQIDINQLYEFLNLTKDFKSFIESIRDYL
jgi:uncharacterized protein YutE (UPF0331/DUF86 family)